MTIQFIDLIFFPQIFLRMDMMILINHLYDLSFFINAFFYHQKQTFDYAFTFKMINNIC